METLRNLYMSISRTWRVRIIIWAVSFLFGLIVRLIWGVEALLTILILGIFVSALFRTLGIDEAWKLEKWSVGQFFGYFRGVIIFAFLPVIWELIKNPSFDSAITLSVVILCVLFIWDSFGKTINNWGRTRMTPRRRRRR